MNDAEPVSSQPIASIRDLRISIGGRQGVVRALRGISLDISPGEIVALVGESGSGKSVLSRAILGFLPEGQHVEVSGEVRVAGVDMLHGSESSHRQVRRELLGAVFQDPLTSLNPSMPIGNQLVERGIPPDRARQHLAEAGVPAPERRFRQYPHELSGGLRQRATIAIARGGSGRLNEPGTSGAGPDAGPRLIVADEPTTALDTSVQAQVLLLFDRLRRDHGTAILLVTHDLAVASSIADRIVVIYAGRLCEVGPSNELISAPIHPYTRTLLEARRSIRDRAGGESDVSDPLDPRALPIGCAFAPRCPFVSVECEVAPPELIDISVRPLRTRRAACLHPIIESPAPTSVLPSDARPRVEEPTGGVVALELSAVSRSFGSDPGRRIQAVDEVSLTVRQGASMALVGESGSGKTTVLRIAAGLVRPDQGSVRWAGGNPQLIYQDATSSLTPWMSIGEAIRERLEVRGIPRAERAILALDYLARVGLEPRVAESRPKELSGGQRQRAVIARALASEPTVLLCDEPVSALDASLTIRILRLLEEVRERFGVALLVVTHDLEAARYIADEIAVMYLGRIVEHTSADEVISNPRHPYTQGLLAASPGLEPGRLSPTLSGEPPDPFERQAGCAFAPRCPIAVARCASEVPVLRRLEDGRAVACHLA